MTDHDKIRFFHALNTRSSGVLLLLEELGVSYELHVLNMKADEQRKAIYLAINPMGKVPAILHGDALVTEQVAIFLYVAGVFPRPALRRPCVILCADRICGGWFSTRLVSNPRWSIARRSAKRRRR